MSILGYVVMMNLVTRPVGGGLIMTLTTLPFLPPEPVENHVQPDHVVHLALAVIAPGSADPREIVVDEHFSKRARACHRVSVEKYS